MWQWRNEATAREASGNAAPIAWEDHVRWFAAALSDADRVLLVGAVEACPCGGLRFDRLFEADAWRVSIVLAPDWRGRGVGGRMLEAGCAVMRRDFRAARFAAEIMLENIASARMFAACGFRMAGLAPDRRFQLFTLP